MITTTTETTSTATSAGVDTATAVTELIRSASEPQGPSAAASSSSPTESQTPDQNHHHQYNASTRKRTFSVGGPGDEDESVTATKETYPHRTTTRRRSGKVIKVTRACDACKTRKARCSGTLPCDNCTRRREECRYAAAYTRGRPVSPKRVSVSHHMDGDSNATAGATPAVATPGSQGGRGRTRASIEIAAEVDRHEDKDGDGDDDLPKRPNEAPSRASPELGVAEIQGQYHDTTSGHAFLYRAYRRLSRQPPSANSHLHGRADEEREAPGLRPGTGTGTGRAAHATPGAYYSEDSPTLAHGDKPLELDHLSRYQHHEGNSIHLPSYEKALHLSHLYFDVCIATYRFLHRPSVEAWLDTLLRNHNANLPLFRGIGCARAAIALTVLAIATAHDEKRSGRFLQDDAASMERSDSLFAAAGALVQQETSSPTLESAQARLVQVLYLLTTSRMNQAWYVFGTAIQLISALGLHRRRQKHARRPDSTDYITAQCRMRTMWTAYILDEYLGVLFGRPRHYHEEDIDQDMPDCVNDDDMLPTGPRRGPRNAKDCTLDALVAHSRLALILGAASRTVYSIQPSTTHADRLAAAHRRCAELRAWRAGLPPHLNSGRVRPSSLVPCFRRQSVALTTAYCHAMIHVNRLFILSNVRGEEQEAQIRAALGAAGTVLEMVDDMIVEEGLLFHAFWWTQHVTFCALAVVYACEVQCRRGLVRREALFGFREQEDGDATLQREVLLALAEKCESHLAQATASNSPSRRYSLILEVLRKEAISKDGNIGNGNGNSEYVEERETSHQHVPTAPMADGQQQPWQSASDLHVPYTPSVPVASMGGGMADHFLNGAGGLQGVNWSMQEWQSEDWQDLDSMVSFFVKKKKDPTVRI